eukprot:gene24718-31092_t
MINPATLTSTAAPGTARTARQRYRHTEGSASRLRLLSDAGIALAGGGGTSAAMTAILARALAFLSMEDGLLININGMFVPLQDAVIGAAAGYLALWSIYWLFKLATGKEGMGYGDFKLLAALGAWLGWATLPTIILLSSVVGAVVGICLMVFAKRGRNNPIPFGPYLAAAGLIALMFGGPLAAFTSSVLGQ